MANGAFHLIVIAVAVWGILTGYRKGLLRQAGGVLAMAFGIVMSRMLTPELLAVVESWIPPFINGFNRSYLIRTLTAGIIYLVVFSMVQASCFPIGRLMGLIGGGILNRIAGAAFRMFKYLFVISIVYNLIIDIYPQGDLTRSSRQHDGNVVEVVMKIAPAFLDFPDGEEVGYRQQLEDAKKIS